VASWKARAATSFPVPLSPSKSTLPSLFAAPSIASHAGRSSGPTIVSVPRSRGVSNGTTSETSTIKLCPMRTIAPARARVLSIFAPPTSVPLRLSRSRTTNPSAFVPMRTCLRETRSSPSSAPANDPRPMSRSPSSRIGTIVGRPIEKTSTAPGIGTRFTLVRASFVSRVSTVFSPKRRAL
jgi:hypothetical protein